MPIRYYSTNGKSPKASFEEALLTGQASDKGLYMPDTIPRLSRKTIASFAERSYPEIAFSVMQLFLEGVVPDDVLKRMASEAYTFAVPVERVYDERYLLRLDGGPTGAFKDFAALMLARLFEYFQKKESDKLLILVATSGDTGGAVANAFYGCEKTRVIVLFPDNEVSIIQRKQMTTFGGNITAYAVDGTFDDCQAMVKRAFADPALKHIRMSSANSINFGRLMPQIVYYFYAYSRVVRNIGDFENKSASGGEVVFSVPSGNMGNMVAGVFAKKMGLPVRRIIAAHNENDEFVTFLRTGVYKPIAGVKKCLSTAMNIGNPSNLARLIALYGGHIDEKATIHTVPDMAQMKNNIAAVSISDSETVETIKAVYNKYNTILDPHSAVGWAALDIIDTSLPCISTATAHPAKFADMLRSLSITPDEHYGITQVIQKEEIDTEKLSRYEELLHRIRSLG